MPNSTSSNSADIREALLEHERDFQQKRHSDTSLRAVLSSLHSDPDLRKWVTLESRPLIPLISHHDGKTYVNVLLVIPVLGSQSGELQMPWAYVAWEWPSRKVAQFEKLPQLAGLTPMTFLTSQVVDATMADQIEAALRNNIPPPEPPADIKGLFAVLSELKPTWKLSPSDSIDLASSPETTVPRRSVPVAFQGVASPLKHIEQILVDPEFKIEQSKLIALRNRMARRGLTLLVAGGIGSGKTNLINKLLDRTIIPARSIADTEAAIIQVRSGSIEELHYLLPGNQPVKLPLSEAGWKELTEHISSSSEGMVEVRVLGSRFLDLGLRLIEIEHDLSPSPQVLEALAVCDIALMTVSALAPLSLSDLALIEEHFLARKTPRLAIVITRLDQCETGEQARLLNYIRTRLEIWKDRLVLGTTSARRSLPTASEVTFAGIDELRTLVEQWSHDSDHAKLLERQALSELAEISRQALAKCRGREQALLLKQEERKTAISALRDQINRIKLDWSDLKLETSRRAIEAGDELRSWLLAQKADLLDQILPELNNQPDPKGWWEKTLAFRLRKFVGHYGKEAEVRIRQRMNADTLWLQEKASQITKRRTALAPDVVGIDLKGIASAPENTNVPNLNQQRLYARIGLGGVTVLAYLVGGPLGIGIAGVAASIGGTILTELKFNDKVEKQKTQLAKKLDEIVDQILSSSATLIRVRLSELYMRLCLQLETEEREWLKARLAGLESPITLAQEGEHKERIRQLETLLHTLVAA
jgi:hypothetical protein